MPQTLKTQDRGCVFFNFGSRCLNNLFVSLYSLRKHYSGPLTVFLAETPHSETLQLRMQQLKIDWREIGIDPKKMSFSNLRALLFEKSPYKSTLLFDSDLLFRHSPESLFDPLEEEGVLVTRFYPPPRGIEDHVNGGRFADRIVCLESLAHLVSKSDFEVAKHAITALRIDVNVGVMGISKPKGLPFLYDLSQLIAKGKEIPLVDEMAANILIHKHSHFLAEENWNFPANEQFQKGKLSEAKIVHYFADVYVINGKRLGRDRKTESGKLWFSEMREMHASLPLQLWRNFDPLCWSYWRRLAQFFRRQVLRT